MSRLFDALRDSTGFRQSANGKAGEDVWHALGIDEPGAAPSADDADINEALAPDPMAADELAAILQEDALLQTASTSLNDSLGIPTKAALDRKARLIPHSVNPVIAEHYRRLRTKILQQQTEKPFRSLAVTSAAPQEGKTVTVLNLGLSFSTLPSFKVLLVDGDFRTGTLGSWLGVDAGEQGFSDLINGSASLEDVILKSDEIPMHFMVRGTSHVADMDAGQLESHLQRMAAEYDLVLLDTPPVNLIADAQLLAASCDAVLLVARAFATTRKTFERTVHDLARYRVIGTVLNAGVTQDRYQGKYYGK